MSEIQLPGDYGTEPPLPYMEKVPDHLRPATTRLQFPPSYVVVGVYRLFTDKTLYVPAWKKCSHGFMRGAGFGLVWAVTTFKMQRWFVELFLIKSPRVTVATIVFLSSQLTAILTFFLSRNIRVARDRVYDQTIASRGKGPDFWKPYVEEWDQPPKPKKSSGLSVFASSFVGRMLITLALAPLHLVPVVGIVISAYLRALGTARHLHKQYFKAKGMTDEQISVFIEERKWDYRAFGFAASLLEGLPFIGLVFTISNRIGAAMWAHDLEKRQHYVAEQKAIAK
ncbi:unnamed protein product [Somion occarium]|uniref:Uncharacterized protein n=1 Tax=Somion occarium TaxID=3059160 RepID=A0ABP1CGQ7_9APHY